MSQFHTDEYVEFLSKITPANMNNYVKEQLKCEFLASSGIELGTEILFLVAKIMWETTAPCLMGCLSIALSQLVALWASTLCFLDLRSRPYSV